MSCGAGLLSADRDDDDEEEEEPREGRGPSGTAGGGRVRCVPWCGVRGVLPNDQERLCLLITHTQLQLARGASPPGKLRLLSSV